MSTLISRDPVARQELHRNRVYGINRCSWCGQMRHNHLRFAFQDAEKLSSDPEGLHPIKLPAAGFYLYAYEVQTDGGSTHPIKGLFCSVACMRAYHA